MIRMWMAIALVAGACGGRVIPDRDPEAHAVIEKLSDEISTWSGELGIEPRRRRPLICAPGDERRRPPIPTCEQPVEPKKQCRKTCGLAELICDNADDICAIAKELGGDRWADRRCRKARDACRKAQQVCCDCEHRQTE